MENIVLSCYLLKKVGGFLTGFFGRFLVNQLGIFVGDFWEFLVGVFAWGFLGVGSFWVYQYFNMIT